MGKPKKDTRFHFCLAGCGEKVWGVKRVTCFACKVLRARLRARLRAADKVPGVPPRSPYGAAYTRGLEMSRQMRQAMR